MPTRLDSNASARFCAGDCAVWCILLPADQHIGVYPIPGLTKCLTQACTGLCPCRGPWTRLSNEGKLKACLRFPRDPIVTLLHQFATSRQMTSAAPSTTQNLLQCFASTLAVTISKSKPSYYYSSNFVQCFFSIRPHPDYSRYLSLWYAWTRDTSGELQCIWK